MSVHRFCSCTRRLAILRLEARSGRSNVRTQKSPAPLRKVWLAKRDENPSSLRANMCDTPLPMLELTAPHHRSRPRHPAVLSEYSSRRLSVSDRIAFHDAADTALHEAMRSLIDGKSVEAASRRLPSAP